MAGMAALRAGAGSSRWHRRSARYGDRPRNAPELMTEPLPETAAGAISCARSSRARCGNCQNKTVLAIGPGLTTDPRRSPLCGARSWNSRNPWWWMRTHSMRWRVPTGPVTGGCAC